jgi:tetratricopeptide (TPR) repeat protein
MRDRLHAAGPGRTAAAASLVEMHADIAAGRRAGATVFVGGDDRDGRRELLRTVAAKLRGSRSTVLAGRFEHGEFTDWGAEDPSRSNAYALLKSVVPMAETLSPVVALLSALVTQGTSTLRLVSRIRDRGAQVDPALLLPQLLRLSAQDGPVACIVDVAPDAQTGWWEDLLTLFAREVAADLPVLLVIGLEGDSQLDEDLVAVPTGHAAARALTRRAIAQWWPLERVSAEELATWIGPADRTVVDALASAAHGRSVIAAQLWDTWQAARFVEQRHGDAHWSFTTGGRVNVVTHRLSRLVEGCEGVVAFERARELLAVAALEGDQFTAEAVMEALGLEREATLDYLDETLAIDEDNPDGIVEELGHVTILDNGSERTVWLYGFASALARMTMRESLTADEESRYAARLAHALVDCYGTGSPVVVATAARLFRASGHRDLAAQFWRMTRTGQDDEITVWRAMRLLEEPPSDDPLERALATELLIAAASALYDTGPYADGLALAQAALVYAADASEDEGVAWYYSAWFRSSLGQDPQARDELHKALAIARRLHLPLRIADARHQLANLDYRADDYVSARRGYRAVLEVRVRDEDLVGVVTVRQMLAVLDGLEGHIDSARAELTAVLEIERHLGELHRQSQTLTLLAQLDSDQGKHAQARERYQQAIEVTRADENPVAEAGVRHALATMDHALGELDAARDGMREALGLFEGHPWGQALAHQWLGTIESDLGNVEQAHRHLREAVNLYRALGDSESEAEAQAELDQYGA